MNILEHAIKYLNQGFSVIPMNKNKTPYVAWEKYKSEYPSEKLITEWWSKFPDANIAIVCGELSNLTVLDVDSEKGKELLEEHLPENLEVPMSKTPKGWHYYFEYAEGVQNKVRFLDDCDVRTQGGLIIAPPSKNGEGKKYSWIINLNNKRPIIPSNIYNIIKEYCKEYANLISKESSMSSMSSNVVNMFELGRRDNDLFHVANCLSKGGMPEEEQRKVLEHLIISWGEEPDKKWINTKVNSAMDRSEKREGTLAGDVRDFVLSSIGVILSSNVVRELNLSSRGDKKNVSKVLSRMCDEKLIEKTGMRHGEYMVIDQDNQPVEWLDADDNYIPLWLPLGLDQIAGILPGNIILFAGAKDSGKTAFLLNIAKENRHKYNVKYFNSEMGPSEFKLRIGLFNDMDPKRFDEKVKMYMKYNNFHQHIHPGKENLNIIDFLEAPDDVWKVGGWIKKIHERLDDAICVIAIQKKGGQDLGRGAEFSIEKARLYVSLDYGKAKIISCKNFRIESPIGNPRGYSCKYKLVQGSRIIKDTPWTLLTGKGEL